MTSSTAFHEADLTDKYQGLIVSAAAGDFRFRLLPSNRNSGVIIDFPVHFLDVKSNFVPLPKGRKGENPVEIGLSIGAYIRV